MTVIHRRCANCLPIPAAMIYCQLSALPMQKPRSTDRVCVRICIWFSEGVHANVDLYFPPSVDLLRTNCRHRSNQMAQHLSTKAGFKRLWNVEGGIDAYAKQVDSSVGVY